MSMVCTLLVSAAIVGMCVSPGLLHVRGQESVEDRLRREIREIHGFDPKDGDNESESFNRNRLRELYAELRAREFAMYPAVAPTDPKVREPLPADQARANRAAAEWALKLGGT